MKAENGNEIGLEVGSIGLRHRVHIILNQKLGMWRNSSTLYIFMLHCISFLEITPFRINCIRNHAPYKPRAHFSNKYTQLDKPARLQHIRITYHASLVRHLRHLYLRLIPSIYAYAIAGIAISIISNASTLLQRRTGLLLGHVLSVQGAKQRQAEIQSK